MAQRRRQIDPGFATMEDVMEAAGVSYKTIQNWMKRGLVPTPLKVSLGYPSGVFNRFPAFACEQVRFIAAMRAEGLSMEEIKVLVDARDWSKAGRAPPAEVESRDAALPTRPAGRRS
jgi:DNA-binding transcriptional MerR regulator